MTDSVIPSIRPDELLDGYRGWLAALNAIGSCIQVTKFISHLTPDRQSKAVSSRYFLESVALVNNRSISDIVMEHTLWPLITAVGRPSAPEEIELMARHPIANGTFNRKARKGLWLCDNCVKEDLKTRKSSYWRCSHQVPGRHSCQVHKTPLRVIGTQSLMLDRPDEVLHRAEQVDKNFLAEIQRNSLARRFEEFIDVVFKEKIIFERSSCLSAMKLAIRSAGKGINPKLQHQYFLSRPENSIYAPWLGWVTPVGSRSGHRLLFKNSIIPNKSEFSITTLAIVASVIFSSPDEAIHALRKG